MKTLLKPDVILKQFKMRSRFYNIAKYLAPCIL